MGCGPRCSGSAGSGVPPLAYCAPAPGNRTKAGCVHPGKESMAVRTPDQREYGCPDTGPRVRSWQSARQKASQMGGFFAESWFECLARDQRDAGPVPFFALAGCVDPGKESMAVRPPDQRRHSAFYRPVRKHRLPAEALRVLLPSAAAQYGCSVTLPSGATGAGGALPPPWHPAPSAGPAPQARQAPARSARFC